MYLLIVYLHVTAAAVWVGGLLFLALVAIPVARTLPPPQRASLVAALGRRFLPVAWTALAILVVTGAAALAYRGVTWESVVTGRLWGGAFGRILLAKLILVMGTLALSALHDFHVGPASTRLAEQGAGDSTAAVGLRRRASGIARANTALALAIVALAVVMVRGLR
ncbi:MAG: CopD family protein [Armatimonadota bacterium]|nr:CopD family protein [Armatimonadota bacterium]MDR7401821.1 CopD family protein [Armatimonadota bacterium]MDR7403123.1 CopD family protein [Armatimonadota bacterium]MDR7438143.1 CopD family protein [Armatimonadota bacterium]MDR7471448.1 CopD family protein [Armatimonadota bacterium]